LQFYNLKAYYLLTVPVSVQPEGDRLRIKGDFLCAPLLEARHFSKIFISNRNRAVIRPGDDYATQRRIPKDSALMYRKAIAANAVEDTE
jgi:hypothetical protein